MMNLLSMVMDRLKKVELTPIEAPTSLNVDVLRSKGCCGIAEIHYLYDMDEIGVEGIFKSAMIKPTIWRCAFVLFSGYEQGRRPHKLRDFIQEHDLGEVWESEERVNHNSGNNIKMFVWSPDREQLKDFVYKRYGLEPWEEGFQFDYNTGKQSITSNSSEGGVF